MYLAYTPEEEALRAELRAYFATIMTPEVEAEVANGDTGGPHPLRTRQDPHAVECPTASSCPAGPPTRAHFGG